MKTNYFAQKTGKISIPSAKKFKPSKKLINPDSINIKNLSIDKIDSYSLVHPYKFCYSNLKQGCYQVSISPSSLSLLNQGWEGTIRVEKPDDGICISGDLYKKKRYIMARKPVASIKDYSLIRPQLSEIGLLHENSYMDFPWSKRKIKVFPRRRYYAYLLGTSAQLFAAVRKTDPCIFNLNFDLYEFNHDETGYEGAFPFTPTKTIHISFQHTDEADEYTGTMYEGDIELGSVTMQWVSSYFRKAYLDIHTLQGAEAPQPVDHPDGTRKETFSTIFATAGWDLTVSYKTPDITMPDSLAGLQASNDCWSRQNAHELLETVSTYAPANLDKKWKVHMLAIEGKLGCSRGRMFDNEINLTDVGDANNVAREGVVTYSHDGYDSSDFGDNENDLQKDTPRAFIRSAAHEVGHAFNMIHQHDEAGSDNSIMTVSPGVAIVLDSAGLDFPEDINLAFNELCRHHLIHRPDPWVRPGALEFTGSLAGSPEADDVYFYDPSHLKLDISLSKKNVKLGEALKLSWRVTNTSKDSIVFPEQITDSSFTARISIIYPDKSIRYIRPVEFNAEIENPLRILKSGQSCTSESMLFWNKKGFVFLNPGKHNIEINILWADDGCYSGVNASEDLWVDYPITDRENIVASIILHKDVGRYVAFKGRKPIKRAIQKIEKVISKYKDHPACEILKEIPGHRYSLIEYPSK